MGRAGGGAVEGGSIAVSELCAHAHLSISFMPTIPILCHPNSLHRHLREIHI